MIHRRLSLGKSKKEKKDKPQYPQEIRVCDGDTVSDMLSARSNKKFMEQEALKYWKGRAEELEGALDKLEDKVSALERERCRGGGSRGGSPASFKAAEPLMAGGRSSPPAPDATAPVPASPGSPGASPSKRHVLEGGAQRQRKDEIMKQLVLEMERLIEFHASKVVEERVKNASREGGSDDKAGCDSGSPGCNGGPKMKIETSKLEKLLTRALDAPSSPSRKNRKPAGTLYQLSCKKCVGQNFVGSTGGDIKTKAKECFAVIWQVVKTVYGKGLDSSDGGLFCGSELVDMDKGLSFRASSFAHHVAMHCSGCESEKEVYNWCLRNVKVEKINNSALGGYFASATREADEERRGTEGMAFKRLSTL